MSNRGKGKPSRTKIGAGFKEKPSTVEAEAFLGPIHPEMERFFLPGALNDRQACADMRATALRLAMQGLLNPRWLAHINELGRDTSSHMAVKEAGDKLATSNLLVGIFRMAAEGTAAMPAQQTRTVIEATPGPSIPVLEDRSEGMSPDDWDYQDDPPPEMEEQPQERVMERPTMPPMKLGDIFRIGNEK